ncbi:MAG: dTDP-4-dehydrorhamnose reductase [Candidatus Acidiferrales bacterium]
MKQRILLIGKNGQVGRELERILAGPSELEAFGREELDLAKPECVRKAIREFRPNVIMNAAAYTAVDKAESEEPLARAINADAPAVLAEGAKEIGAALVHYSTDYVFDGRKGSPYVESDATKALSVYGRTKLAGENAIRAVGGRYLIFRTEWVYATQGKNFLLSILRLATEREELRIVSDQAGAPTWSREIAAATAKVAIDEWQRAGSADLRPWRSGTYHMTAAGQTSWFDFARAIIEHVRGCSERPAWLTAAIGNKSLKVRRIVPIATKDYPTPARRPAYSVLSNSLLKQTFGVALPDWRIQLETALAFRRIK